MLPDDYNGEDLLATAELRSPRLPVA